MVTWRRVACGVSKATRAQAYSSSLHMNPRPHQHTRKNAHTPTLSFSQRHTHTHKYAIFIIFPQQKLFGESALILNYTYIACLVKCCIRVSRKELTWRAFSYLYSFVTSHSQCLQHLCFILFDALIYTRHMLYSNVSCISNTCILVLQSRLSFLQSTCHRRTLLG
jgi:hypothetical protein